MTTAPDPPIASRHLRVSSTKGAIDIFFTPQPRLTVGSTRRAQQAVRIVKSTLKRIKNCEIRQSHEGVTAQASGENHLLVRNILEFIDRKLDHLESEPLTTKMVEEILKISSRERVRWTKDGRLPSTGKASFKRGKNRVHLFMYPPLAIAELASRPQIVTDWRAADSTEAVSGT